MFDPDAEAEQVIRCFDPHASLVAGEHEHLVISPRWARLRRSNPLLASSAHGQGTGAAWQAARKNLLGSRDRTIQLAIATYEYRVRVVAPIQLAILLDQQFDLNHHCATILDRHGKEKSGVVLRREAFWIRTLTPDPDGFVRFEFGNSFLIPITEAAIVAEAKSLIV